MAREKPTTYAERILIEGMLDGTYPPGSFLPGERELCKTLGVARPALREALQRLARDGWLDIQQGKATQVKDFLRGGNLPLLTRLLQAEDSLVISLVPDLLEVWTLMAPAYTRRAIEHEPKPIGRLLAGYAGLADKAGAYAQAEWQLHRLLLDVCGNPIYGLIVNSFNDFYRGVAQRYYTDPQARVEARDLWQDLYGAALTSDGEAAAQAMSTAIQSIREHWWERIAKNPNFEPSKEEQETSASDEGA
ncbi:MAG: GntR family transcriptional regulator [Anaerolineae bacterium]|nr:GntR family transcriptional regulator [Anaerolineae bacterium]